MKCTVIITDDFIMLKFSEQLVGENVLVSKLKEKKETFDLVSLRVCIRNLCEICV